MKKIICVETGKWTRVISDEKNLAGGISEAVNRIIAREFDSYHYANSYYIEESYSMGEFDEGGTFGIRRAISRTNFTEPTGVTRTFKIK